MTLTLKYEIPVNEFLYIPEGSEVKVLDWNEYEGFSAIEYKGMQVVVSDFYFNETKIYA